MTNDVVDGLFEDQKNFAPEVCSDFQVEVIVGRVKTKFYIASGQNVIRKPSHPAREIAEVVSLRVDGPDNVTHRIDRIARSRGDGREPLFQPLIFAREMTARNVAEHGYQRQVGTDVVMKVGRDPRADSLQLNRARHTLTM